MSGSSLTPITQSCLARAHNSCLTARYLHHPDTRRFSRNKDSYADIMNAGPCVQHIDCDRHVSLSQRP